MIFLLIFFHLGKFICLHFLTVKHNLKTTFVVCYNKTISNFTVTWSKKCGTLYNKTFMYMYIQHKTEWGTTDIQSCPIKLPPLFRAPAVWVVPVWLIHRLMREWCHLYAILIEILQQNNIQYISIICSCCC